MLSDPVYLNKRDQIADGMQFYRLPAIHSSREYVVAGGLASYGASISIHIVRLGLIPGVF